MCFNSSKVRLIEVAGLGPGQRCMFQFLEGAIDSNVRAELSDIKVLFQFLEGAIDRLQMLICISTHASFNSSKVRLIEIMIWNGERWPIVSIPRRCD